MDSDHEGIACERQLDMCEMGSGKKEVARELGMKSREHDRLAVEARARANGAAYDGFNRKLLNRWKVHHFCARWTSSLYGGCLPRLPVWEWQTKR